MDRIDRDYAATIHSVEVLGIKETEELLYGVVYRISPIIGLDHVVDFVFAVEEFGIRDLEALYLVTYLDTEALLVGGRGRWCQQGLKCGDCLLYTSPSPRDATLSRMPSSA